MAAGSRQPAQAVAPILPQRGSTPGSGSRQMSAPRSQEESRCGQARQRPCTEPKGQMDRRTGAQTTAPRRLIGSGGLCRTVHRSSLAAGGPGHRGQEHGGPGQVSPVGTGTRGREGPMGRPAESRSAPSAPAGRQRACCPSSSGRPAVGAGTSAGDSVLLPGSGGRAASGRRSQGRPLPEVRGARVGLWVCAGAAALAGEGRGQWGRPGREAASSSKATGCRPPGSWAQWDTPAGCSPRSCCTEPPGTVGSATRLCSTQSAPSGSFRQPPGRSCAP